MQVYIHVVIEYISNILYYLSHQLVADLACAMYLKNLIIFLVLP